MNRDSLLFLLIGALCGFIVGYMAHERMAAHQPPPLWGGTVAGAGQAVQAAPGGATAPNPGAPFAGQPIPGQGAAQGAAQAPDPGAGAQAAFERVQQLRTYVAENPDDLDAVRTLGNLNYDIANWAGAAELYERYLAGRPTDADVLTDLGACYRNLGRLDEALAVFARARAAEPEHWQAYYNEILVIAFDQGDPGRAMPILEQLESLQPANPDVARLATEVRRRAAG